VPPADAELRTLLKRVADRDRQAFLCLYQALRPALVRHLYRLAWRADQVEELLNDVMWVAWQNAGTFRGDAQVTTWVLGIATLKSRRARERWRREQAHREHSVHDEEAHSGGEAIDHDLEYGLSQLSTEHREALELTYYHGYSCSEVAERMNCPIGTVKTRLHHARRRLRQVLEEFVDVGEVS